VTEWECKLLDEAAFLHVLGYLRADGTVRCPECGAVVDRDDGWTMRFACACGWWIADGVGA